MDSDSKVDPLNMFLHGDDIVVDGIRKRRQPQVTNADKTLHCLRATRENLLWAHIGKFKPCVECDGVEYGDFDGLDNLINDIQSGKKVPQCSSCHQSEEQNNVSYRQLGNKLWNTLGVGNSHTDIIFSNNCNAACLYCTPRHSSRIQKEFSETKHNIPAALQSEPVLSTPVENRMEIALEHVKRIAEDYHRYACVGVYGGEPSLDIIEEDYVGKIVSTFYEHNKMWARTLRYDFNSHFNFSEERCKQLVAYFNYYQKKYPFVNFIIQPSIDSLGKYHNFLRYGTDWTIVERNLDYFLANTSLQIEIKSTISNVSLKNLPQFIEHMNNKCKEIRPFSIEIDCVNYPVQFSCRILDGTFMKYVNDVWYYLENNKPYFINIDDIVVQLKELTTAIDAYPDINKKNLSAEALEIYEYFKKERNIDILEVNPELYYYFKMLNIS